MSEFEKVFGKEHKEWESNLDLLAKIRDDFFEELEKYAPSASLMSSAECTFFAIYKALENKTKSNKINNNLMDKFLKVE